MKAFARFLLVLTLVFVIVQPTSAETSSIGVDSSRQLDKAAILASFVTVQLDCSLTGNISGLIITERIPSEFKFVNSSSNPLASAAKYNETASEVKWLFIGLQQASEIVITYTLEIPTNIEEKTYTIEGYWKAVDRETGASGVSPSSEIQVSARATDDSMGYTIPIHLLIIVVIFAATAVFIVAFLIRRHWVAGRGGL